MSKVVGLSRFVKPEWLDKTVELLLQEDDNAVVKNKLDEYLSYEIKSPTNLRKTREILLRIWVKSKDSSQDIHCIALEAYKSGKSDKLALNWAMILLAYPIFADIACRIGKISMIQDSFSSSWLKEKLAEKWGDRTTLFFSCEKILQTLNALGVLEKKKLGVYAIKRHEVKNEKTVAVLLLGLLELNQQAYYDILELGSIPLFFPFKLNVSTHWLHHSPLFNLSSFGGRTVLTKSN